MGEEKKKKEMKEQASKELEEWYSQHKETIEKTRLSNRNAEKELASQSAEVEPGQEWERIAKLCDFNPKASRNNKDVLACVPLSFNLNKLRRCVPTGSRSSTA